MPTDIKMPQLGESVTEGTIGRWLKQPGQRVEKYEALLEVTTDKVDTEVPAPVSGIVREIAVPEGTTVRVGTLLAVLDDESGTQEDKETSTQGDGAQRADSPAPLLPASPSGTFISPVVARLVSEHHLDIGQITGRGQGGRVTKQDVLRYLDERRATRDERPGTSDERRAMNNRSQLRYLLCLRWLPRLCHSSRLRMLSCCRSAPCAARSPSTWCARATPRRMSRLYLRWM